MSDQGPEMSKLPIVKDDTLRTYVDYSLGFEEKYVIGFIVPLSSKWNFKLSFY
jgi:hypothetical protein